MNAMRPSTWRPGCPVPLGLLRKVVVPYHHPSGGSRRGTLIVHQAVAAEVGEIFIELHRQQFPIQDISPALTKLGKDDALMRSNVTSAFNCRAITGEKDSPVIAMAERSISIRSGIPTLKEQFSCCKPHNLHAPRGMYPKAGLIHRKSSVVKLFERYGWKWGGHWKRVQRLPAF